MSALRAAGLIGPDKSDKRASFATYDQFLLIDQILRFDRRVNPSVGKPGTGYWLAGTEKKAPYVTWNEKGDPVKRSGVAKDHHYFLLVIRAQDTKLSPPKATDARPATEKGPR